MVQAGRQFSSLSCRCPKVRIEFSERNAHISPVRRMQTGLKRINTYAQGEHCYQKV